MAIEKHTHVFASARTHELEGRTLCLRDIFARLSTHP